MVGGFYVQRANPPGMTPAKQPIYAILAQLLIAYTRDFDEALQREFAHAPSKERPPSLAMWANVLRFLDDDGIKLEEISLLSGIAKPTIKSMVDCLHRHGWVAIDGKRAVRLTKNGKQAQLAWQKTQRALDRRWTAKLGTKAIHAPRTTLGHYSDAYDSKLPDYPMPAAHRGAFPTGD